MMIEIFLISFGLILGSFLNVVIYRIPLKKNIVFPRSFCPKCNHTIKYYHNIPVISYLILRGKCKYCKAKISFQYPIVEILGALSLILAYSYFKIEPLHVIFTSLFLLVLIILAFIDLNHKILPDEFTIGGSILFFIYSFFNPFNNPGPIESFMTGIGCALLFLGIYYFYLKVRKIEGLGLGDIKYIILLGVFLGVEKLIIAILLASISGLMVGLFFIFFKKKDLKFLLPFGTFLSLGSYISFFFSKDIFIFIQKLFYLG